MELETANGLISVDLSTTSLDDVSNIIAQLSTEVDVPVNSPTVLYSS